MSKSQKYRPKFAAQMLSEYILMVFVILDFTKYSKYKFYFAAMTSETTTDTLDRQNQQMTENLAKKISRLRDVCNCINFQ